MSRTIRALCLIVTFFSLFLNSSLLVFTSEAMRIMSFAGVKLFSAKDLNGNVKDTAQGYQSNASMKILDHLPESSTTKESLSSHFVMVNTSNHLSVASTQNLIFHPKDIRSDFENVMSAQKNLSRPRVISSGEEQRKARRIAVVGLYNSGSSILTKILYILGVRTGQMTAPGKINHHYENFEMKVFLRKAWNEPYGIPKVYSRAERVLRLRNWIEREEAEADGAAVCLKHPLLALSLDDVLNAWGDNTTFIWAHRPLNESIAALSRRRWFGKTGTKLQNKLWLALRSFFQCGPDFGGAAGSASDEASCRLHQPLLVNYRELLDDPLTCVQRIITALGLTPTTSQIMTAVAAVRSRSPSGNRTRMKK